MMTMMWLPTPASHVCHYYALQIYHLSHDAYSKQKIFDYAYETDFNGSSDHSGGQSNAETFETKYAPPHEPSFHHHASHQEPHQHPQPEYHHYPESAYNYHQHHELELAVDSLDLKGP